MGAFPKVQEGALPHAVLKDIASGKGGYQFLLPGNCVREDLEEGTNDFKLHGPKVGYRGYRFQCGKFSFDT